MVVVEAVSVTSGGVRFPLQELPLAAVVTVLQEAVLTHGLVVSVQSAAGSVVRSCFSSLRHQLRSLTRATAARTACCVVLSCGR